MRILKWGRATGKTTECYRVLNENEDAIMVVILKRLIDVAPKNLQPRMFSWRQLLNDPPKKGTKIIIDEPEFMPDLFLRELEKHCNIILVAGTPHTKEIGMPHWFKEICEQYGCEHKTMYDVSWLDQEYVKSFEYMAGRDAFNQEVLAKFSEL